MEIENKQVTLTSTVDAYVGIDVPDLHLKRLWERKGAKKKIPFDVLQEAFYDPSVEYLLREGILYIDDLDVKIALGLEDESAREPDAQLNIQLLKDEEINRLLTVMPIYEFKEKIKSLTKEQVQTVVTYAIKHEITNFEKSEFLKEYTGVDIINTVRLNHEDKEE